MCPETTAAHSVYLLPSTSHSHSVYSPHLKYTPKTHQTQRLMTSYRRLSPQPTQPQHTHTHTARTPDLDNRAMGAPLHTRHCCSAISAGCASSPRLHAACRHSTKGYPTVQKPRAPVYRAKATPWVHRNPPRLATGPREGSLTPRLSYSPHSLRSRVSWSAVQHANWEWCPLTCLSRRQLPLQ